MLWNNTGSAFSISTTVGTELYLSSLTVTVAFRRSSFTHNGEAEKKRKWNVLNHKNDVQKSGWLSRFLTVKQCQENFTFLAGVGHAVPVAVLVFCDLCQSWEILPMRILWLRRKRTLPGLKGSFFFHKYVFVFSLLHIFRSLKLCYQLSVHVLGPNRGGYRKEYPMNRES